MKSAGNHFHSRQLLELDACTRCGECQRWCEAYSGEELTSPRQRLLKLRRWLKGERLPPLLSFLMRGEKLDAAELHRLSQGTYRCTLCARCREVCPVKIDTLSLWLSLRERLVAEEAFPTGLSRMKEGVEQEHNVFSYPKEERATWLEFMSEVPGEIMAREQASWVYFVGCVASFSPAVQSIPQAVVSLLLRAGLDLAILGEEEWCCGFPLIMAGMKQAAAELRAHNIERIKALGASNVVFSCPSCFRTWREYYQPELPGVRLWHATQVLDQLLREGKYRLEAMDRKVVYHDPCDLGRNSGVYQAPRRALTALPGVTLVEMNQCRDRAHCCGGGGDLEVSDPDLATTISVRTLTTAAATGAGTVVTACQQCKRMFLNAEAEARTGIRIADIAELALEAARAA